MPFPPRPTPRPAAGLKPKTKAPRGVLQVDWALFGELCRVLALKVFREYDPQVVIGIAKAGVIPGAVVASILQRDFASIAITREGSVIAGPPRLVTGKRVLLVDETCESGNTMKLALAAVREQKPSEVKTAVSFKTGPYKVDFFALENENFIILPWDLEVIVDGEIVVRPDYRDKLKDLR
jgi:hypoxanthine phosphoribosyltransferase